MSATAHLPQIAKIASIPKTASYETITATPASPHIGAEIGAIDLTKPLANKEVEELHDAFARYQVIFFRNQKQVDHQQDDRQSTCAQIPLRRELEADFRRELSQRSVLRPDAATGHHAL